MQEQNTIYIFCGVQDTLNLICAEYWIPQGRRIICKFIFNCSICKKNEGKSYSQPQHSHLPKERLSEGHAFLNADIDFAGPLYVTNIDNSNSSVIYKAQLVIITCASSRGIQIDLVAGCTSESCIKILRRFISIRGTAQVVILDNGKYFTSEDAQIFVNKLNIKWKFNIEDTPWTGGFYERLISSGLSGN